MEMKSFTTGQVEEVLPFVNKLGYDFKVQDLATIISIVSDKFADAFDETQSLNTRVLQLEKHFSKKRRYNETVVGDSHTVFNNATRHPVTNQSFESILFDALLLLDNTRMGFMLKARTISPFDLRVLYPAAHIYGMIFSHKPAKKRNKDPENFAYRMGLRNMIVDLFDVRDAFEYQSYIQALNLLVVYISELPEKYQDEFMLFLSTNTEFRLRVNPGTDTLSNILTLNSSKFSSDIIRDHIGFVFNFNSIKRLDPSRLVLADLETKENNKRAIEILRDEYVKERFEAEPFLEILKDRLSQK